MKVIAIDTETQRFRPGCMAPPMVCLTWAIAKKSGIVGWKESLGCLPRWLLPDFTITGHYIAYDLGVICAQFPELIPLVFQALDDDRITCTKIRQQLLDIAAGEFRGKVRDGKWHPHGYSLDDCAYRNLGRRLDKPKEGEEASHWRLNFSLLRDTPVDEWPEDARSYAINDAIATHDVYMAQEQHRQYLADQYRQTRAQFWLGLMSTWGMRTTKEGVEGFKRATLEAHEEVKARLVLEGLVRKDGTRDTKKATLRMVTALGENVRRTKANQICLDADACEATDDPVLHDYAEYGVLNAVMSKDIPMLEAGTDFPVHTRYDMAASGRTTSSGPNIQNLRRKKGIREAFVPRPGTVFIQADFPSLELHTLGQVCKTLFGESKLLDALNSGIDPHTSVASNLLGVSYERAIGMKKAADKTFDNARQTAKVANFGFPGGLGPDKLVLFARKTYQVLLTRSDAVNLKNLWFETWPEMRLFFEHVNRLKDPIYGASIRQLFVDRIRGGCTYNAACNTYFQGLGADCAKEAGWLIAKACYVERNSPLFGSRPVAFVHDEFIVESPEKTAPEAAVELGRLMALGAKKYLPDDVGMKMEPQIMTVWSKEAKPVFDTNGRLVPWAP